MMVVLRRFAYLPDCTLGWLIVGQSRFATLERPWIPNPAGAGGLPRQSCVPEGSYALRPHDSARFPVSYVIESGECGVYAQGLPHGQAWGRVGILIHPGNSVADVIGCIAVGSAHRYASGAGQWQVPDSRVTMKALRAAIGLTVTTLKIEVLRATP